MALTQNYTDTCGNTYEPAYWRATSYNVGSNIKNMFIAVTFQAWKDAASFAAELDPLPGALKTYSIKGDDFNTIAQSAPEGSTLYDVLGNAAETYALNKQDTPDGNGNMVSFFAGATQVSGY